ncbi:MAG TPA: M20/M25/M40 family metallo-hydrolase [Thermoanaerobaculia bacterium]|nr:M20/M25/M40 family metallo-hydrolase [Thermoanaerobaculia bacterium]
MQQREPRFASRYASRFASKVLCSLALVAALTLLLPASSTRAAAQGAGRAPALSGTTDAVDLAVVTRIRDEGLRRSRLMATIGHLTDVIGPRLTGSPQLKGANEWTRDQLAQWGLANAHLEAWGPFGRGWSFSRAAVHMVEPQRQPLFALPKAWTPGTAGPVRGAAMRVVINSEADFEKYRGKLRGKILLFDKTAPPPGSAPAAQEGERPRRFSAEKLAELGQYKSAAEVTPEQRKAGRERLEMRRKLRKFLTDEGALATVDENPLPWGVLRVQSGGPYKKEEDPAVPGLVMAAEHYGRLVRLLGRGERVELEIEVEARFHDDDPMAYNTIADLPGTDRSGELVMVGAHLDSWHTGTGATDNAAGCAVAMEALRILRALDLPPRRTIRIALWSGEEEGLLGSEAYVGQHFASRPEPPALRDIPERLREPQPPAPLTLRPEYPHLSAYFNIDNGSGKIRGIYAQENAAVVPIFSAWLEPFRDLGAETVVMKSVGSTDHVSFDRVGLPAFQFIQDELDYSSHTHHTNADVYDHLESDDLIQSAVIVASLLYDAAMRPQLLPRKPPPPSPPARPADRSSTTTPRR